MGTFDINTAAGLVPSVSPTSDEAQIQTVLEERLQAVRDKDVDMLLKSTAPNVVVFDVVKPLQPITFEQVENRAKNWFTSYAGPIECEMDNLSICVGGDVAFCHFLTRYQGQLNSGKDVDMWVRSTLGLQKIEGDWFITHEHSSDPYNPATGKVSFDLNT